MQWLIQIQNIKRLHIVQLVRYDVDNLVNMLSSWIFNLNQSKLFLPPKFKYVENERKKDFSFDFFS